MEDETPTLFAGMRIDVSRLQIQRIRLWTERSLDMETERLRMRMHVLDKVTGEPIAVESEQNIDVEDIAGFRVAHRQMVRRFLLTALEHELDECLLIDGTPVRDPHEDDVAAFQVPDEPPSVRKAWDAFRVELSYAVDTARYFARDRIRDARTVVANARAFSRESKLHLWRAEKHWSTVAGVSTPRFVLTLSLAPAPPAVETRRGTHGRTVKSCW